MGRLGVAWVIVLLPLLAARMVECLVQHGADVKAKDAEGRTPLDYMAGMNDAALRRLLDPKEGTPAAEL